MKSAPSLQNRMASEAFIDEEFERATAHAILSTVSDGFLSLDRHWLFDYINPGAERMIGQSAADLLGKCLWAEFPQVIGTRVESSYRAAMATGESVEFDYYSPPHNRIFSVRAYP